MVLALGGFAQGLHYPARVSILAAYGIPYTSIPYPLLIMRGSLDPHGGGPQGIDAWSARDRHARVAEIAAAGHNANQDRPHEFNQLLPAFLRTHVRRYVSREGEQPDTMHA